MITESVLLIGIFAIIFTIFALLAPKSRLMFALIAIMLCFITAAGIAIVEVPYTFYDQTAQAVVSGTTFYTGSAALSYMFFGLGMFNFAIALILMVEFITGTELTEGEVGD